MGIKYPCGVCKKVVKSRDKALCCDLCQNWVHIKCNYITPNEYENYKNDPADWYCIKCIRNILPFSNVDNGDFYRTRHALDINNNVTLSFKEKANDIIDSLQESSNAEQQNLSYYNVDDSNKLKINENSLKILHLNISSITSHIDNLKTLLSLLKKKFDIICLSETRIFKNLLPTLNIQFSGYNFEYVPTESKTGGVGMYLSSKLNYKLRPDLKIYKTKELESLFVELLFPKRKNIIVGCVYKHPNMTTQDFNDNYLELFLHETIHEKKQIIIAGDFNFNLLKYSHHNGTSNFVDKMFSYNFIPKILHPTRITPSSATLIDNIFINTEEYQKISGNLLASLSDHLAQFLFLQNFFETLSAEKTDFKRDFKNFDDNKFKTDFTNIDWSIIYADTKPNIDIGFRKVLQKTESLLDKHAPKRK